MPSKARYYQINSHKNNSGWIKKFVKNKRRRQVMTAIVAGYALVAGAFSYTLLSGGVDYNAEAGKLPAHISSSLRMVSDGELSLGSSVDVVVTLQNKSITDSINNISLELQATNDIIKWDVATLLNDVNRDEKIQILGNQVDINSLSPGERVEYNLSGVLEDNTFSYLAVMGKVLYHNIDGIQIDSTNKVFTKLDNNQNGSGRLLSLKTDKSVYSIGDNVRFDLSFDVLKDDKIAPQTVGKIYITKNSDETVAALSCSLGDFSSCSATLKNMEIGNYTAMYIGESDNIYSQIYSFKVSGKAVQFSPSSQASVEYPFGNMAINGEVAVIAKRVMNMNNVPSGESCSFEVLNDEGAVVKTYFAKVENDRTCYTTLNSAEIPGNDTVYDVRLANSDGHTTAIIFSMKNTTLPLATESVLKIGNDITISSTAVESLNMVESVDEEGNPIFVYPKLDGNKATLGIWHARTGSFREVTYIDGQVLKYEDGDLSVKIPANYFKKGGTYKLYIKTVETDDSDVEVVRYSEFLPVIFDAEEVGFTNSGINVSDYNNLKAGQSVVLTVDGVTDRSGNEIATGACEADIYQADGSKAINTKGTIKDGVCSVTIPKGKVTKSGPALVTFSTGQKKIDQTRLLTFVNNKAEKFTDLNMEYEPARIGYANELIIGPVTDAYDNLANAFGYEVEVATMNSEIETLKIPVNIVSGFAKVTIPANMFVEDKIVIALKDNSGDVVKQKDVLMQTSTEKLIVPNFPIILKSSDKIEVGVSGLDITEEAKCKLVYYKSMDKFVEEEVTADLSIGGCEIPMELNKYRDNKTALMTMTVGNTKFTKMIKQEAGEPSNMFTISPSVRVNSQDELQINLITSPIADNQGMLIDNTNLRLEYNGNVEEVVIKNGVAELALPANKIQNKDIRNVLDQRFLELGLDARASVTSISKTNNLSIFLGTKSISNDEVNFGIQLASTNIEYGGNQIFKFRSETCNPVDIYEGGSGSLVSAHWQSGSCYVQVGGELGNHNILFNDNGFNVGMFQYKVQTEKPKVVWCDESPCQIQVMTSTKDLVEALVYDTNGNQYHFETESLNNVLEIEQNGLNSLKDYLVEIRFTQDNGEKVSIYNEISGELLSK